MSDPTPYHLSPHTARALLDPLRDEVARLEERIQHYEARIPLASPGAAASLREAAAALVQARSAIEALLARDTSSSEQSAPPARRRVLITGAAGRIGSDLALRLRDAYDPRLLYHHTIPADPPVSDWVQADSSSVEALLPVVQGMDAIVHMAADPSTRAPWESVLPNNIIATYNLFEAARQAGVRRIVFASTNHVMGMYDRDNQWPIYADQPVRPDSLYGVSKAFGENLGRFYYEQYGLSVICLRIGWMLPEPRDAISRWMWLSPRDCAQVVSRALDTDLGFGIFYAISANSGRHWDITKTIELLGYRPEDDAERYFEGE